MKRMVYFKRVFIHKWWKYAITILWNEFSSNLLIDSFNYTGVCFQDNFYSSLEHIIGANKPISNYVFDELDQLVKDYEIG